MFTGRFAFCLNRNRKDRIRGNPLHNIGARVLTSHMIISVNRYVPVVNIRSICARCRTDSVCEEMLVVKGDEEDSWTPIPDGGGGFEIYGATGLLGYVYPWGRHGKMQCWTNTENWKVICKCEHGPKCLRLLRRKGRSNSELMALCGQWLA